MYEVLLFAVAVIGAALASWEDLKTTEVRDEIPVGMVLAAIALHGYNAFSTGNWVIVKMSFLVGLAFLAFGYILYYTGQWGEADVFMLAATGVLLPRPLSFFPADPVSSALGANAFPLVLISNIFILGGVYTLVYALVMSLKNKDVFPAYYADLKGSAGNFTQLLVLYLSATLILSNIVRVYNGIDATITQTIRPTILFAPAFIGVFLLYKFAKVLDAIAFKRKVSTDDLLEGDVLAEPIKEIDMHGKLWVGLTKKQVNLIRSKRKDVWIKEGVRWVPSFLLGILATAYYGNALYYMLSFVL